MCGGCYQRFPDDHPLKEDVSQINEMEPKKSDERSYNKIRLYYKKDGSFRFFSQLNMIQYIERLVRKSGIFFRCSEGFHPRMKITSLPPLPVSAVGKFEVVELYVDGELKEDDVLRLLNKSVSGFSFDRVMICNDTPPLSRDMDRITFELDINVDNEKRELISSFWEIPIGFILRKTEFFWIFTMDPVGRNDLGRYIKLSILKKDTYQT